MAKQLSKTGINSGQDILAKHVTQSIDAFTGADEYDITLSGSLSLQGTTSDSQTNLLTINTTTGKIHHTASSAIAGLGNLQKTLDLGSVATQSFSLFGGEFSVSTTGSDNDIILRTDKSVNGDIQLLSINNINLSSSGTTLVSSSKYEIQSGNINIKSTQGITMSASPHGLFAGDNYIFSPDVTASSNVLVEGNITSSNGGKFSSTLIDANIKTTNITSSGVISGSSKLFISASNFPSPIITEILCYNTESGQVFSTKFKYKNPDSSGGKQEIGGLTTETDIIGSTVIISSSGDSNITSTKTKFRNPTNNSESISFNNVSGDAKFGLNSIILSGSTGDISASGEIKAKSLSLPLLTFTTQSGTEGKIAFGINQDQTIRGYDDNIVIDGDNRVRLQADNDVVFSTPHVDNSVFSPVGSTFVWTGSMTLTSGSGYDGTFTARNISSSGNITASNLDLDGQVNGNNGFLHLKVNGAQFMTMTGDSFSNRKTSFLNQRFIEMGSNTNVIIDGNLTASLISASDNISSNNLLVGNNGTISAPAIRLSGNSTGIFYPTNSSVSIVSNGASNGKLTVSTSSISIASASFTTEGIISSSNIVYMSSASIGGTIFTSASLAAAGAGTVPSLSNDFPARNITASGAISASGTIQAQKLEAEQLVSRLGDPNTGLQFLSDTVQIEANDQIVASFATTIGQIIGTTSYPVQISGSNIGVHGTALNVDCNQINFLQLPTSDPGVSGRLWRNGTDLKISIG